MKPLSRKDNLSLRTDRDYEELDRFSRSATQTPRYFDRTMRTEEESFDTVKRPDLFSKESAFQDYKTAVIDKLDRRVVTPRERRILQREQTGNVIPPLVYGITPEGSSDEKGKFKGRFIPEGYVPMVKSSTPDWVKEAPVCSTVRSLNPIYSDYTGKSCNHGSSYDFGNRSGQNHSKSEANRARFLFTRW